MTESDLDKKKMPVETVLAKIEDVLKRGKASDPPAYTLILGAGASFGVVPTAAEVLGMPDAATKNIHEKGIPIWLEGEIGSNAARLKYSKAFWKQFCKANEGHPKCQAIKSDVHGLPTKDSIAAAYQAVFETACVGGLDTPERHRNYIRAVTMAAESSQTKTRGGQRSKMQLNATHFYLASLLSLQKRLNDPRPHGKPLYTGRREFARTIFTTNFDPLLQTSLQLFQLLYYMTDRPELLSADALQTDEHPAIHLFYAHGSVHRPYMANTAEQINLLKQRNARDLAPYLGNHGVIVLGYSGWDDCLLEALNQTQSFANNLYWLARGASSISKPVAKFVESHSNAYWVEIDDGGNFMAKLHSRLCPGAPNTEMLSNPISPLLTQLDCVNLGGIQRARHQRQRDQEKAGAVSAAPRKAEEIRQQVIARLRDAQKLFTELPKRTADLQELLHQAELSYANEDWQAALAGYNRLLRKTGLSVERKAEALFRRGYCYGEKKPKKQTKKEMADYTSVIKMRGAPAESVARARYNRGVCYNDDGDKERAIKDYSAVIGMQGAPVELVTSAQYNRGVCYGDQGDKKREMADYTAVIKMRASPVEDVSTAQFNRGFYYEEEGETGKAMADYTAVINMRGAPVDNVAAAQLNRGRCYGKKADRKREMADYTAVINMGGAPVDEVASAQLNRGICYGEKSDTKNEMADYTAVIEMPGAPVEDVAAARVNRAVCYEDEGQTEKAIEDYSAVIQMRKVPPEEVAKARLYRGMCYDDDTGKVKKARADYTAVIQMSEGPAEEVAKAQLYRGMYHAKKGETKKAKADYTAVIRMSEAPEDEVKEAKKLIKALGSKR